MPHSHDHAAGEHRHGHANDQGIKGALRYLRWLPRMWTSEINDAVVDMIAPRPGERVLDIGAGLGAGAVRAAATGAHVIAVEPTPFLRRLLTVRRALGRADVDVVDGTAERIPVETDSIDALWAVNTMHHWTDPERGAAEVVRVLRPGGRVVLVDERFTDPDHPDHDEFGTDHGPEHHGFTMVDADHMKSMLEAAGLAGVDASSSSIADRPVIAVTAGTPTTE